jgi:23S rRNA (cytidine1920-2'-O)/16S rRNA (cytidine1409-2'-O)-methyltransferase
MQKKRLDVLLVEKGFCETREKAQAKILAGEVFDEKGSRLEKPGLTYPVDSILEVKSRSQEFKSRAGHKLQFALDSFGLSVADKVCLDVGASTGGFTHCLLKSGARHVVAVDVGYGQLDVGLRQDSRVTNLEKMNARYLKKSDLGDWASLVSLVVVDVSFISIRKVIEPLSKEFSNLKEWILLFKPQFEVGPKNLGKKGKVKNQEVIDASLEDFQKWMTSQGFLLKSKPETSPLPGKKSGNLEYLVFYERENS